MIQRRAFVDSAGNIILDRSSGSVIAILTTFVVHKILYVVILCMLLWETGDM